MSVEVERLSYRYPNMGYDSLVDVNLKVDRGEFVLLVGKSGCGKTTLARCINGLIPHVFRGDLRGVVRVDGVNVAETPVYEMAKIVGMVFQNPDTQLCTLTVEDEVAFGPENMGVERDEIERRVRWALSSLGLEGLRWRSTFGLSDGEKQRVAVAAALSMLPKVLVLDEPTANLDPKASEMLVGTLRRLRDEYGITIILVEHRVDKFIEAVDRVVVMDSGRIVEDGPPEVVVKKADLMVELGIRVPEVVELCKAAGIPVSGGLDELRRLALERMKELRGLRLDYECPEWGEEILRMEGVVFSYGGGFSLRVDEFSVHRGEVVAVIGGNGSGKTTLAKLMAGLVKPKKGSIKRRKGLRVGMVFQNFEVQLFNSTVFGEVAFQLSKSKLGPDVIKRRVESVLAEMGLLGLAGRHPHSLSQGEKQRVVIASLTVDPPDILILDEPTTGQDGYHLKMLEETIRKVKARGVATVVITHDLSFAARVAERAVVISGGRVAVLGDIREVLYGVDEAAGFTPPETVRLAREAGLRGIVKPEDVRRAAHSRCVNAEAACPGGWHPTQA